MTVRAVHYPNFGSPERRQGPARTGAESACEEGADAMLARARGRARADGFAEGVAEAETRIDAEAEAAQAALLDAVRRAEETMADTERAVARRAQDAVSAFLGSIAPHLAKAALGPEIESAFDAALNEAPAATLVVEVSPGRAEAVAEDLAARACDVRAASDLDGAQARVRWEDGFDRIDMTAAARRAIAVIEAHLAQSAPPQPSETAP